MRIFFSVGEPSGDLHGANLIRDMRALDDSIEFVGYGGPKMAEAGCVLQYDLTKLAVMFILEAITKIHLFWKLLRDAEHYFKTHEVDAVVLIDFPGFNWWIARKAKAQRIPVFYYGVPQLWAWAPWRIRKIQKYVDHVLSKLRFETEWYQSRGCQAVFVGHPYFDEIERQKIDSEFVTVIQGLSGPLITLLPGSRDQEVTKNLPSLLHTSRLIADQVEQVRFVVACFHERHVEMARQMLGEEDKEVQLLVGRTPELIRAATCCLACSGSVSLELMYHLKPSVIQYRISPLAWLIQGVLMRCQYITLVNLFWTKDIRKQQFSPYNPDSPDAELVPFPEYLSVGDQSPAIAKQVVGWLTDPTSYEQRVAQLKQLKQKCAQTGASRRSAEYIISHTQKHLKDADRSRPRPEPQAA